MISDHYLLFRKDGFLISGAVHLILTVIEEGDFIHSVISDRWFVMAGGIIATVTADKVPGKFRAEALVMA